MFALQRDGKGMWACDSLMLGSNVKLPKWKCEAGPAGPNMRLVPIGPNWDQLGAASHFHLRLG